MIRTAKGADVPCLVQLNPSVHDVHLAADPVHYAPTEAAAVADWYTAKLAEDGVLVGIVEDCGADLGFVLTVRVDRAATPFSHARRTLVVDQLAVVDGARGRGLGGALMDWAEARARALGCASVVLDVAAFNTHAEGFYRCRGYVPQMHRMGLAL